MIIVRRKSFLEALRAVATAPAVYVILTAKAGASFGRLSASGGGVRIDREFPLVRCDADAEGAFVSNRTTKYLAECANDQIEIEPGGYGFRFRGAAPSFSFSTTTDRNCIFTAPLRPYPGTRVGTVGAGRLADEFQRVAPFAAVVDSSRFALTGVLFDNSDGALASHSWLVASTGSVFVASKVPFNAGRLLVPAWESKRLAAALVPGRPVDVYGANGGEIAVFASQDAPNVPAFYFSSTTLAGTYPERSTILNAHKNGAFGADVADASLAASQIVAAALVDAKNRRTILTFSGGRFTLTANGAEVGSAFVEFDAAKPSKDFPPEEGATSTFDADTAAYVLKRFFVDGPVSMRFGATAIYFETPNGERVAAVATLAK